MNGKSKIAVVYTGMPLSLVGMVEAALGEALPKEAYTLLSLGNPSIIEDAILNGSPSEQAAQDLVAMYMAAAHQGARVILNACSSVGDIADMARPLLNRMGVRLLRIDEDMARSAVRRHRRIGVMATLRSTLAPTVRLIERAAAEEGRKIELVEMLADDAFGLPQEALEEVLVRRAEAGRALVDCFLLAQGSMAGSEAAIARATLLPVYSSPRYGAEAVARALNDADSRGDWHESARA
jgi:hypothetical protein